MTIINRFSNLIELPVHILLTLIHFPCNYDLEYFNWHFINIPFFDICCYRAITSTWNSIILFLKISQWGLCICRPLFCATFIMYHLS